MKKNSVTNLLEKMTSDESTVYASANCKNAEFIIVEVRTDSESRLRPELSPSYEK